MKKTFINLLLYFILPVAVIIFLFVNNTLLGVMALVVYVAYALYAVRSTVFSFTGNIAYAKGNVDKALTWFERAFKSGKASPRIITSYAYLLLKSGNISESGKVLNNLLNTKLSQDDKMYAKSNLALVLWKKGELDNAITMLEEVISTYKTSVVYGSLGYLYILKGDMDKALEFNMEAYEYNSSNTVIQDNLGQIYYLLKEYDKAIEIYEKLMQSNPAFPEAYYNYGLVLSKKGEYQKALDMAEKACNYKLSFLSTVSKEEIDSLFESLKKEV